jgi:hypothetical protein
VGEDALEKTVEIGFQIKGGATRGSDPVEIPGTDRVRNRQVSWTERPV